MLGTYIHIPFCDKIWIYCDFAKEIADTPKKSAYLQALFYEMNLVQDTLKNTDTVYIGGGTPTSLNHDQLRLLFDEIKKYVDLSQLKEFTLEANPNHLNQETIEVLLKGGVTRLSLGVQSLSNSVLKTIGRQHDEKQVYQVIADLRAAGLDNFSVDVMFGLPGQTLPMLKKDLHALIDLKIPHMSIYALILEDHTPLKHKIQKGHLKLPSEDVEGDMFDFVLDAMEKAGYEHYEIANYALPGYRSFHNPIYWRNEPYIGIGAGAHGRLGQERYEHHRSVKKYTEDMLEKGLESLLKYEFDPIHDTLFMGLRMKDGVDIRALEKAHGFDFFKRYHLLNKHFEQGLLHFEEPILSLTRKGMMFANEVLISLLEALDDPTR
jgi:putative oxygen-independent coproporphyrinogen III oxidase